MPQSLDGTPHFDMKEFCIFIHGTDLRFGVSTAHVTEIGFILQFIGIFHIKIDLIVPQQGKTPHITLKSLHGINVPPGAVQQYPESSERNHF